MTAISSEITLYLDKIQFLEPKKPEVDMVEQGLNDVLSQTSGTLREMCDYLLQGSGKRIRPLLVYYCGQIFSDITPELTRAAVAAELIHMASLVHDDIIDEAEYRRYRPSVHQVWGPQNAVLCGDYLFTKAFDILAESPQIGLVLHLMANAVQCMSDGELRQADDRYSSNISIDRYYERATLKTAIFLQNACKSGAYIAGAESEQVKLLGDFGLHFGLAFQIIDDILDFFGNPSQMGKAKHEDLSRGNITLPTILLLQHPKYGPWLVEIISKREFSEATLARIEDLMKETGIFNKSLRYASLHVKWAKNCLAQLPAQPSVDCLESLINKIPTRVY